MITLVSQRLLGNKEKEEFEKNNECKLEVEFTRKQDFDLKVKTERIISQNYKETNKADKLDINNFVSKNNNYEFNNNNNTKDNSDENYNYNYDKNLIHVN